MEKVLTFGLDEQQLNSVYKMCSQMKIMVIAVSQADMMMSLSKMMEMKPYKGGILKKTSAANVMSDEKRRETMLVMCDVTDKHVDKILATLRMTGIAIDYKALMTPVNKDWNGVRMLAQMAAEKRAIEG